MDGYCSDDGSEDAAALLLLVVTAAATACMRPPKRRRRSPQKPSVRAPPWSWGDFKKTLNDRECIAMFRMNIERLEALHDRIGKYLTTEEPAQGERSSGHSCTSMQRLCVALRFMAGGAVHDIRRVFPPMGEVGVYDSVHLVVDAVNHEMKDDWTFPRDDVAKLKELEKAFRALSPDSQCWIGQVGCVDGMDIAQGRPPTRDAQRYYVSRKGGYMLLLLAIADANRRILWWDMSSAATTHDKTALLETKLGAILAAGSLPHPFFISGDAAFRMPSPSLLCPVPAGWDGWDNYNYVQSSLRMPIECAFGILYRRWGVLWRPLTIAFERRPKLVSCLIRLNNWCIDGNIDAEIPIDSVSGTPPLFDRHGRIVRAVRERRGSDEGPHLFDAPAGARTAEQMRTMLRNRIAEAGIVRPPSSRRRSSPPTDV
eukprot:CAMPEP_0206305338 /NCGR_PEP_ID=MMETSP0106_2-20121207/10211_1 /ASSEMBLY_ACC=CAM_ASM_000206 /TAXON_ID=81532 /ORGANISM="Acanthoeca-like sp., Strain 10tr" /LENGTH=426 /DNA_ID=CAMNT_0053736181 /DNA_START=56 /DNA_END=1336 /DNA_ORIENTATION=+